MVRRRMTVKRLDPWSVLKFGAVANVVLFAIMMLVAGIVWFIVDRLRLVDQACGIATDVGFTSCGVDAGNLFRALSLLGGMGVIVGTAVMVFAAFLYNLISDLTGGLSIGVVEEGAPARPSTSTQPANGASTRERPLNASSGRQPRGDVPSSGRQPQRGAASRPQEPVGRSRSDDDELFRGT